LWWVQLTSSILELSKGHGGLIYDRLACSGWCGSFILLDCKKAFLQDNCTSPHFRFFLLIDVGIIETAHGMLPIVSWTSNGDITLTARSKKSRFTYDITRELWSVRRYRTIDNDIPVIVVIIIIITRCLLVALAGSELTLGFGWWRRRRRRVKSQFLLLLPVAGAGAIVNWPLALCWTRGVGWTRGAAVPVL
jgi:hypothetical protein